ncbi:MAG: CU044_5270 family protein [Streptosporangiaceae bacterium]
MNDQCQTVPDDLSALARLWADTPDPRLDIAAELLRADIRAQAAGPAAEPPARSARTRRAGGRRWLVVTGGVAAAAITGAALIAPHLPAMSASGSGPGRVGRAMHPAPPGVALGTAHTEAELVAYAVRSASLSPSPRTVSPHSWFYARIEQASSSGGQGGFMFGRPDQRVTYGQWTRADFREIASYRHGKLIITRMGFSGPAAGLTLGGWPSVSWRYLSSLPTDPRRLERVIAANNRQPGQSPAQRNYAVFSAINHLLSNELTPVLPSRLDAGLYGVLKILPGVEFDQATDLAGRPGMGFFMRSDGSGAQRRDGWLKEEIVISPSTYQYLGSMAVAVRAHTFTGPDGSKHVAAGHILGWRALLDAGIVAAPGRLPR